MARFTPVLVAVWEATMEEEMFNNSPQTPHSVPPTEAPHRNPLRGRSFPSSDYALAERLINEYAAVGPRFDVEKCSQRILVHIESLRRRFGTLENVQGQRILDVACGSRSYEESNGGRYHPWMPRLLVELGATPVGIDIEGQEHERFESYELNILKPDVLGFLPSGSFDAYNITAFPTIKALEFMSEYEIEWEPVKRNLLSHLSRILKPGARPICTLDQQADDFVRDYKRPAMPPALRRMLQDDDF